MELLITNEGLRRANEAQAGGWLIKLTHFGLSDSTETPSPDWKELPGERVRLPITAYYIVDDNTVEFRCIADESVGDFWVRRFGLYLEDGTLFAVGETPLSQKLRGTRLTVKAQVRLINAIGTFDFKDLSKDWVTILFHELAATAGSLWQTALENASRLAGHEIRLEDLEKWTDYYEAYILENFRRLTDALSEESRENMLRERASVVSDALLWQAVIALQSQIEGLETRISGLENWKNNISQEV